MGCIFGRMVSTIFVLSSPDAEILGRQPVGTQSSKPAYFATEIHCLHRSDLYQSFTRDAPAPMPELPIHSDRMPSHEHTDLKVMLCGSAVQIQPIASK